MNDLGSRIEILGSEGVYLDEKCRTNPSRYLPGPKPPGKKIKNSDFGISGVLGENFIVASMPFAQVVDTCAVVVLLMEAAAPPDKENPPPTP